MRTGFKRIGLVSALGIVGCSNNYPGYHYDGPLFGEHVELYETWLGTLVLEVEKDKRRTVSFIDGDGDLQVDEIEFEIEKGLFRTDMEREYDTGDTVGKAIIRMAQPEFERYWKGIEKKKIEEARSMLTDAQEPKFTEGLNGEEKAAVQEAAKILGAQ